MAETRSDAADPENMLGLLTSIKRGSGIIQRKLAGDLGMALGLANAYLRRCVRKGLIKMSQILHHRSGAGRPPLRRAAGVAAAQAQAGAGGPTAWC